jgi:hypothetical protein
MADFSGSTSLLIRKTTTDKVLAALRGVGGAASGVGSSRRLSSQLVRGILPSSMRLAVRYICAARPDACLALSA